MKKTYFKKLNESMILSNVLGILLVLFLISCGGNGTGNGEKISKKLKVVATTGMLYDAVIQVGDTLVEAQAIMGPGVDPHLYKATQGDLKKLRDADVIVYNGLLLEGKMGEILGKLGRTKPVIAAAESIPDSLLQASQIYEDAYDPHVWFDVRLWQMVVQEIALRLSRVDTANAGTYRSNAMKYINTLDTLHDYAARKIQSIPPAQRVLVTAHDAFGYFGKAYNIDVEGLQGISTVSDFGLKDIADLTDLIIDRNVKAIFIETSVSDKAIKAVLSGCQGKGHDVVIGGKLYSDAMGEFGTYEGTYLGMVEHNVNTITEALK